MKLLDERGIGTVWSICKEKFALTGHTHNYAGSGSPGGSANSAIGVVDYGQTGKTIQIGYSGTGITGDQIKYIAGYTDGSGNVNAKIKDVSKDALRAWLGLGSLAYSSSSIPTNLSLLNNDKGFVTGSVSGNTVTINGVSTTFALAEHTHNYLPLSGGTLTGDLLFSNSGTTFRQIRGTCGDNDFWRIGGGATGSNAGYMEIATADDGTEPIYVRQYSGTFSDITRTATLLDGSGNTSFPGTVSAAKFKGALEGNASTASNAYTVNGHTVNANVPSNAKFTDTNTWRGIQDNLTSTSTSESLSANQGRILKGLVDSKANSNEVIKSVSVLLYGDTISGFTPNIVVTDNANRELSFTIDKANGSTNGLMSIKDKNKLDLIADRANNYTLPVASSSTLGGVKVSGNADGSSWPICVDSNGLALAKIQGLLKHNNRLSSVMLSNEVNNTYYNANGISTEDSASKKRVDIGFPLKSGTLALTSDLSDVCRFNFVNSISECRSDRINFFLRCNDPHIDLNYFDAYPDGTILIITATDSSTIINHRSKIWYSRGEEANKLYDYYTYNHEINLITKNNGTVHHYVL